MACLRIDLARKIDCPSHPQSLLRLLVHSDPWNIFFLTTSVKAFISLARETNPLPSSLLTPYLPPGWRGYSGAWNKGVQRTEGLKLPIGVMGKGIQELRTTAVLGLGFSHLSGPVWASQLPTLPAPLFAALNFLPHQRKWGETAGAATAIGAMVSLYAQESRHLCPQSPTPRLARSTHYRLTSPSLWDRSILLHPKDWLAR